MFTPCWFIIEYTFFAFDACCDILRWEWRVKPLRQLPFPSIWAFTHTNTEASSYHKWVSVNNAAHFQANNPSIPHFSLTVINGLKSVGHWTMHYGMNSSSVGDVKTVAGNSRMTRRPQAMCVARAHLSFHLIWKCNAPILKANNALHTNNRNTRGSSNTHTSPDNERYHQHHLIHSVYKNNFSHIHSLLGSYVCV